MEQTESGSFKKIIIPACTKMPPVVGFMGIIKGNTTCRFEFPQIADRDRSETCMSQIWGTAVSTGLYIC